MKEHLIWPKIECLAEAVLLRAQANIESPLGCVQQIDAVVSGDAKIGLELTLRRNLPFPRQTKPFTNELGELVEGQVLHLLQ